MSDAPDDWRGDAHQAEQHVIRARDLFQRGRLADAEAEMRRALAIDPGRGDWHHNLAVTLEALGKAAEALAAYERAVELLPQHVPSILGAAQCQIRLGRPEDCVKLCERAARVDPKAEPAYAMRIAAFGMLRKPDDAEGVYYVAQQYLDEMPSCLVEMANVLANRGQLARAAWCYREALAQNPALKGVRTRLGVALLRMGETERAHHALLQAMREQPGDAATLLALGGALEMLGRVPEALEKYRRIVELEPANPLAHVRIGDIALKAARLDEARAEYTLVLSLGLRDIGVRMRLVETLLRLGLRAEAATQMDAEFSRKRVSSDGPIARDADLAWAICGYALECGRPAVAAKIAEASLKRNGTQARLWLRLSRARCELGQMAQGVRAAMRARRIDRTSVEALHNVALAWLRMGKLRGARVAVAMGMRAAPADEGMRRIRTRIWAARVMRGLGPLLRALGMPDVSLPRS
jgi:tetratricopeptide (TPR) repeat protein